MDGLDQRPQHVVRHIGDQPHLVRLEHGDTTVSCQSRGGAAASSLRRPWRRAGFLRRGRAAPGGSPRIAVEDPGGKRRGHTAGPPIGRADRMRWAQASVSGTAHAGCRDPGFRGGDSSFGSRGRTDGGVASQWGCAGSRRGRDAWRGAAPAVRPGRGGRSGDAVRGRRQEHGGGPGRASGAADGMAAPLVRDGEAATTRGSAESPTRPRPCCGFGRGPAAAPTSTAPGTPIPARPRLRPWARAGSTRSHPEDLAEAKRVFATANAARKPFRTEFRLRRADGVYPLGAESRPAAFRSAEGGAYLGFVGSVIDIHVRREAEERLRQSEARLKAVFATVPVGIVISEAPSGRIVAGNPQIERILRHPLIHSADIESYRDWAAFHADGRRVEGPSIRWRAPSPPAKRRKASTCTSAATGRRAGYGRSARPSATPKRAGSPAASSPCSTSTRRSAPSRSSAGRPGNWKRRSRSARGSATASGATRATCFWWPGSRAGSGRSTPPGRPRSATGRRSSSGGASTASSCPRTSDPATTRWSGRRGQGLPHFENRYLPPGRLDPLAVVDGGPGGRQPLLRRPRHHRRQGARGGAGGGAGAAPAGAEDGGGRPAHRRHRARLQQPADGRHRQPRHDAAAALPSADAARTAALGRQRHDRRRRARARR